MRATVTFIAALLRGGVADVFCAWLFVRRKIIIDFLVDVYV